MDEVVVMVSVEPCRKASDERIFEIFAPSNFVPDKRSLKNLLEPWLVDVRALGSRVIRLGPTGCRILRGCSWSCYCSCSSPCSSVSHEYNEHKEYNRAADQDIYTYLIRPEFEMERKTWKDLKEKGNENIVEMRRKGDARCYVARLLASLTNLIISTSLPRDSY